METSHSNAGRIATKRFVATGLAYRVDPPKLRLMKQILCAVLSLGIATTATAQPFVTETEEQYARSQAARGEAIQAFRAGDLEKALAGMMRALEDRPTNTALLGNAIFLAAESGAIDETVALAQRYMALNVAPPAAIRAKMQEKLPPEKWDVLNQEMDVLTAASGAADMMFQVPQAHRLVEGIATDGEGGYFLSTVVSGTILKISQTGEVSVLAEGKDYQAHSFFGLAFDAASNSLYATYGRVDQTPDIPAGGGKTGVLKIDGTTGAVIGNWSLDGGTDGQQVADIAIDNTGKVIVSEAQSGVLYEVADDGLKSIETNASFRSPQGLAFLKDGTLMMADYGRGLWAISTNNGNARLLATPNTVSPIGIDGLLAHEGKLIAVQNGVSPHRIIEIGTDLQAGRVTGVKVLAQNLEGFDEPTLGTSTPDGVMFVASSQWPKFGEGGVVRDGQTYNPTNIMLIRD